MQAKGLSLPAGETIGEFEFTTALGFRSLRGTGLRHCGAGNRAGRPVATPTNVVRTTEVSVITPISRDHMAVLGDTVAEIAGEKAAMVESRHPLWCAQTASRRKRRS